MTNQSTDFDVLIVGAGPTGLSTANYLGMYGVRALVVEQNPGTVKEPRAVSIDDESLRSMQTLNLVDKIVPNTLPGYGARYHSPGRNEFARVKPTIKEYGHPRRSAFHQPELEDVLKDGLQRYPTVEILFEHQFVGFEQNGEQVTSTIQTPSGDRLQISAKYLAACDGGHSSIRNSIGAALKGASFEERWLVFDTVNDFDATPDSIAYCDHRRPAISLPGPDQTRRWEFLLKKHESETDLLREDTICRLLEPYIGTRAVEIVRKVVYTFHARVADKWSDGRVFLLGDAAHLTPPYAGQGMNSGQRDAANFAWKAAAVVSGQIDPSLMDSYQTERREHAWSLIQMAIRIGWVMVPRNWFHTYGQITFFKITRIIPKLRDYFLSMKFKPEPRFLNGFLSNDNMSNRHTLVGRMLPQPMVTTTSGETILLDNVLGVEFSLLALGLKPEIAFDNITHPIWDRLKTNRVALMSEPAGTCDPSITTVRFQDDIWPDKLERYRGTILVVRPDRYVAAAFTPEESSNMTATIEVLVCPSGDENTPSRL